MAIMSFQIVYRTFYIIHSWFRFEEGIDRDERKHGYQNVGGGI